MITVELVTLAIDCQRCFVRSDVCLRRSDSNRRHALLRGNMKEMRGHHKRRRGESNIDRMDLENRMSSRVACHDIVVVKAETSLPEEGFLSQSTCLHFTNS